MKAVLFDLDGTLINSEEGITKSVSYALAYYGIKEDNLENLKCFIGPPLEVMFQEKYQFDEEKSKEATEKFRERYKVKGILECALYDGVKDALKRLKEDGYRIALASSKPEELCRRILKMFEITDYFDEIVGSTYDGRINSKDEVLEELKRRMTDIPKDEMCLVGDTKYDVCGAKKFGIECVAVSYGFGEREELTQMGAVCVCDDLEEVVDYIEAD